MNQCEQYEQLISERMDRALTSAEQSALEAHLATCGACREFAASVDSQTAMLRALPLVVAPDQPDQVQPRAHAGAFARLWRAKLSVPLPVAAAIGIVLLGAALVSLRSTGDRQVDTPPVESTIEYVQVEVVPASSAKPLKTQAPDSKE